MGEKRHAAAMAVMLLVLALGCLKTSDTLDEPVLPTKAETEYSHGLKISFFAADFSEIYSDEDFSVSLQTINSGNSKATDVEYELYRHGAFELKNGRVQHGNDMEAPDVTHNIPGDTDLIYWNLKSPQVSSDYPYTFGAKVNYNYRSDARQDFVVLTRQRMLENKGKETKTESSRSIGPAEVGVSLPTQIILPSDNSRTIPVKITVTNIGTGIVLAKSATGDCSKELGCLDKVDVYFQDVPYYSVTCDGAGTPDGTARAGYLKFTVSNVPMTGGKTAYLTCDMVIDLGAGTDPSFEKSFMMSAEASYRYQIESETDILVLGEGIIE